MPHKLGCAVPTATPPPAPANTRSHFAGMRTIAGPSKAVMNLREVSQWPEKVPTRTLSLLKVPTSTFTNKNLLSNYCKQVFKHGKLGLSSAKIITDRQLQGSLQTKPKLREGSLTALMQTIGGPSVIITIITWACPDHPALGLCSVCSIFAKYFLKLKLSSTNLNWAFDLLGCFSIQKFIEYILVTFQHDHSSISWIQTAAAPASCLLSEYNLHVVLLYFPTPW